MANSSLKFDFQFSGLCIVIASQEPEYRLAWALNRDLGLALHRKDDLLLSADGGISHGFANFEQYEEIAFRFWRFLANKDRGIVLMKEYLQFDYFLILEAEVNADVAERLLSRIRQCRMVQGAYLVDPSKVKNPLILMQS